MVDALVHVTGDGAVRVAFADMLWRFEIPVSVEPGQHYAVSEPFLSDPVRHSHGLHIVQRWR